MPDESDKPTGTSDQGKLTQQAKASLPDFSKIKNLKDWLTAAIGVVATAAVSTVVGKALVVASAPFMAEGVIWLVRIGATAYIENRKRNEPLKLARQYRKTIKRNLKKAALNSKEWRQLESDRTEVDRNIHELEMQRIRFSVSSLLPTNDSGQALLNPSPLTADSPTITP